MTTFLRSLLCLACIGYAAQAAALPTPEEIQLMVPVYGSTKTEELTAFVYRPEEGEVRGGVVDLHGCNGIWPIRSREWIELYLDLGLVVLQIDSFNPRGTSGVCGNLFAIPTWQRALDAHAGADWLRTQENLAEAPVFLTGFSHGATTVLLALEHARNTLAPFAGAIASAPWCLDTFDNKHTDLLILIGGADQWTPAQRCKIMPQTRPERLELVVYPGAHHSFDAPGTDAMTQGHRVLYDQGAAFDARKRAREFLQLRLRH